MNRIKQLRKERKLTLAQLSKKIGVAQTSLTNYENEKRQPRNQETWNKIAEYFGVSVAYLMGVSDYPLDEKQIKILVYNAMDKFISSNCEPLLKKASLYFTNKEFDFSKITSDFYSSYVYNNVVKGDIKMINGEFEFWFEDYLIELYQEEAKTNENLIYHVLNSIPEDVYTYNHLGNDKAYLLSDIVKNNDDRLKKIRVSTYQYDNSINQNLINEIIDILDETKQKILSLIEKYPDSTGNIARRIFLLGEHKIPFTGEVINAYIDDSKIVKDELHLPTEIYQSVIEYFNDDNQQ